MVPQEASGERLDRFLAASIPDWSRSRLQAVIKGGFVRVGGEVARKPGLVLEAEQAIELELPELAPPTTPEGGVIQELPLLHQDEHLAFVDKPAGLLSHANDHSRRDTVVTLAEAALGPLAPADDPRRRGLVHRLDRLTSGVMVIARTPEALEGLQAQFAAREVRKTYLALVHHEPRFESEWIEARMQRDPRHPERMRVAPEDEEGREAATLMERLETFRGHALVAAHPRTGRTHQVRVHLTHAGHPIVGDGVYRHRGALRVPLPAEAPAPRRQCLHASRLELRHPVTGEALAFESPLAADIAGLLDWMRAHLAT